MQTLVMKHSESEFLETVNLKLASGSKIVGPILLGTTSKSVGFWQGFPTGRIYIPVYSAILDDGLKVPPY